MAEAFRPEPVSTSTVLSSGRMSPAASRRVSPAAAVDARFAVLVGGAMVAANALVLLASRRLRLL